MDIDVYIYAQRNLSESDIDKVSLYNELKDKGYDVPGQLFDDVKVALELEQLPDEISIKASDLVETLAGSYAADPRTCDCGVLNISDLPPGTVSLRISVGVS
jgi:hypothetical protein